jgi:DGQHR domain-containing protein
MTKLTFRGVKAQQSPKHQVVSFAAKANDVIEFAKIDRIGRDEQGELSGFQRPQIANHIREIKDYLEKEDSVLPNPIVVAFTKGVKIKKLEAPFVEVIIDVKSGPPGLVVDGQQRLTALSSIEASKFEVFVSAIVCKDEEELKRQFILINNTKPLPKSLIYELLPDVEGLPTRLSNRAEAASLTARLNFDERSSLKGLIKQHTHADGFIGDNAVQKVIMNSLNDGIMRDLVRSEGGRDKCFEIMSEYYAAVQSVFKDEWVEHTPRTSRLVHGAGIVSMGYVMELLALLNGSRKKAEFVKGLACLDGRTAWTSGEWNLGGGDIRHWRAIQNVNRDIMALSQHLISLVRSDMRSRRKGRKKKDGPLIAKMRS